MPVIMKRNTTRARKGPLSRGGHLTRDLSREFRGFLSGIRFIRRECECITASSSSRGERDSRVGRPAGINECRIEHENVTARGFYRRATVIPYYLRAAVKSHFVTVASKIAARVIPVIISETSGRCGYWIFAILRSVN